ncbi:YraN family protein [Maricaulis sp.]|uniref:YraN family protein n=1 Tax=Maricaulis sp. TaxID=1486257 RepID=UPI00262D10FC|nr:YraN family protein [Maricaulis sp.]
MSRARRSAEAFGRWAERLAQVWLIAKGYSLLDRRAVTAAGEIDLVARRGEYLAFIEVKARPDLERARAALTYRQRLRIERAASLWRARHQRFGDLHMRYDLFLVMPWRLPVHERAAWFPDDRVRDLL